VKHVSEKVTVIIACYNAERSVGCAVESALAQTIGTRVIVVDDASTDGSFSVVEKLAARNACVTALRQAVNRGPSSARNRALMGAVTPWVATLDADDYMLPDRLRLLVEVAEERQLDFIADDLIRTLPGQAPSEGTRVWKDEKLGVVPVSLAGFVRECISHNTGQRREMGYLKPLMRLEFLKRHELFFRENMRLAEDYELYARSLALGARWAVTDPTGYIAVSQEGSLSRSYPTPAIGAIISADEALRRLPGLSADERRAIGEHLQHTRIDFAWRLMIDAVRSRSLPMAIRALLQPPSVMLRVIVRSARHLLGLPAIKPVPPSSRPTARETTDLNLT
jgi:succinoglycan biosynthesis protein ExoU